MPRKEDEAQSAHDEGSDSDNVMLMTTTNLEGDNSNLWYLDTCYSNLKTGQRKWFVNLDEKVKSKIN